MITRESASQRCPRCRKSFRTLADEVGDHPCPYCGYDPDEYEDNYEEDGDSDN
jgi:Zn finger protein HypA/HybF involved in hydrogenase expression